MFLKKETYFDLSRNNDENVSKTKSKAKNKQGEDLPCMSPECDKSNEEALTECNLCGIWICEPCSDIAISKLKPLIESAELDVPTNSISDQNSKSNKCRLLSTKTCLLH